MLTQLFTLITTPPGNLVYHLVLAFAAAAGLQGIILHQDTGSRTRARRLLLALGIVLACQFILFIASGITAQAAGQAFYLPPLDRAIAAISLIWIAWIWVFPDPEPRVDANISILNLVFVILFFASLMGRSAEDAIHFNTTIFNLLLALATLAVTVAAIVLLVIRRPQTWLVGLVFMVANLAGITAHLVFGGQEQDFSGAMRLAQLVTFPLLPSLARRLQGPGSLWARDRSGSDSAAGGFKTWLELAANPATALPVLLQKLAQTLQADAACLVTAAGTGVHIVHCYDLKRGISIRELGLQYGQLPALSDALQKGHPLRLVADDTPNPDLATYAALLGGLPVRQLMSVPLTLTDSPWAGLVLLSFRSALAWGEPDLDLLNEFSEPISAFLSVQSPSPETQAPDTSHLQQELKTTRTALQQLQAEFERLQEQPAAGGEMAAELQRLLASQQETRTAMQLLEQENRQLAEMLERARVESGQPSPELDHLIGDLQAAQTEATRLRGKLAEAGQTIEDLQRRLEQDPGTQPDCADQALLKSLSGILHDLRQPLSAIIGYTDMLLEESLGTLGALQQRFLQRIRASGERIDIALNDVVQLRELRSRPDSSRPRPVDLISVVDQILAGMRQALQEKELSLTIDLPFDLPPVLCERTALRQVITHLIWNAREVTPVNGQVTVRACIERSPETGAWVDLRVTDQGGGIPPADLPHLFDPDYRTDNPIIPGLADSAAGLWITRSLVNAAEGQIWAESQSGETTFILRLPATTRMEGTRP